MDLPVASNGRSSPVDRETIRGKLRYKINIIVLKVKNFNWHMLFPKMIY